MKFFDSMRKRLSLSKPAPRPSAPTVVRHPRETSVRPTLEKHEGGVLPQPGSYGQGDRILGRYEVRLSKAGGFGRVYLCYDHQHRVPVAVKTLLEKDYTEMGVTYEALLQKFSLEAEAWVRLEKHKNIVQAKGVEWVDGKPHIFLEFVAGREGYGTDLADWLGKGPLGIRRSLDFAIQFCSGMAYAAQKFQSLGKPFVHRDIKPANTMVTHDGVVKITDFGLVKIFGDTTDDIFSGAGTPAYMPPEQWQHREDIDGRADLYAFGCMLYEMLAGRTPFNDNFPYNHLQGSPAPLKEATEGLPERLNDIVMCCLAKDRRQRKLPNGGPLDFAVLKQELSRIYRDLTGESLKEETAGELEAWERLNKGIALSRLGFRRQAVAEYIDAVAADPRGATGMVPANLCRTLAWHCGAAKPDKMVFHIQSVFTNYSQQRSLAEVLEILVSKYGLKLIAVEGGSGKIDLSFYRDLPDGRRKEEIAGYFLKEARIQGHEYFAIKTDADIAFHGAEEPGLHERHLASFRKGLPESAKWIACCNAVEKTLTALKPYIYSDELRLFEMQLGGVKGKSFDHFNFIQSLAEQLGLPGLYPNLSLACESNALRQRLDEAKAKAEITQAFQMLNASLREELKEGFNKAQHEFRQKEIGESHFFGYLKELVQREFGPAWLRKFPDLSLYMEYVLKKGAIDLLTLFAVELEEAEEKIREKFYRNEDQRTLDLLIKQVGLLQKAYAAKLTPHQFAYLEQNRRAISGRRIADFVKGQAERHGLEAVRSSPAAEGAVFLPPETSRLGEHLWQPDAYYFLAMERGRKLVQNCLKSMEQEEEAACILVTGGFHTHMITAQLRERGVAYVVLAPSYELSRDDEKRYLGAVAGRRTPLEETLGAAKQ